MSTSRYENVNKLLANYDECQKRVDGYKETISKFLNTLQSNYNSKQSLEIKIHQFYRVGSSYEDTVVHPQADFDIGMVLSNPYSMEYFSAMKADEPGLYKLKRVPGSSSNPHFLNTNNFLKVEDLKHKVCKDLISVLKCMGTFQGFTIDAKEIYSGVAVELKKLNHDTLDLDIIPQIEGNPEKDLPDWNGENLSEFMKDVIKKKHLGVYFTLTAPPPIKNESKGKNGGGEGAELIVQANFTIIEKEVLGEVSGTVKDAIRISKGLLRRNPFLKTGGLRSFQIKRVALKHVGEIEATKDSWDGYQLLMNKYIQMLKGGGVDGYLIKEQDVLWVNEEKCADLARRLEKSFQENGLENVLKHLALH